MINAKLYHFVYSGTSLSASELTSRFKSCDPPALCRETRRKQVDSTKVESLLYPLRLWMLQKLQHPLNGLSIEMWHTLICCALDSDL
jgi:hypothetical protein